MRGGGERRRGDLIGHIERKREGGEDFSLSAEKKGRLDLETCLIWGKTGAEGGRPRITFQPAPLRQMELGKAALIVFEEKEKRGSA